VQSCHDVGKSFTASRVATWWIDTHPPGEAFVVSTAPTSSQVGAILWREIGRAHRKGQLSGYITGQNEWKLELGGPAELVGYGRKPQDYLASTGFQGIHARWVLVILDEACGIPKDLYEAADALATNEAARVLAIGNPDDPSSYFKTVCSPGSGWNVLHVDALTSPNFTREAVAEHPDLQAYMIRNGIAPSTEDVPDSLRDLLVSPTWVAERIKRWGVSSPTFQSKVRGQFPSVSLDTLIDPHWVTLAQARERPPAKTASARLGVDVARYGADHSIVVVNQNSNIRVVLDIPRGPVTELAGQVQRIGRQFATRPVANVDDVGVGGGVTDILLEEGYPVAPMSAGARSEELLDNGKPRFTNQRSEWWWTARELLAGESGRGTDSVIDIDPLDDDLAGQLTAVKYKINRHGQIEVESKDDMKKRGMSSPDRADAFIMSLIRTDRKGYDAPRQDLMLTAGLLEADF
ncbi:MAG: hypothetical protein LC679_06990, partial [Intrasporangiaceae bacterium]|nr:hypothetical protein [Intrasporangiaceae bacterium]